MVLLVLGAAPIVCAQEEQAAGLNGTDRSPMSLAVSSDGRYGLTANHTSDSVSLIDVKQGRVLAEYTCGHGPADVAWVDNSTALVSLLDDDAVTLLRVDASKRKLGTQAVIAVGDEPGGVALAEGRAYVTLAGEDHVAVVDLAKRAVAKRIPVGGVPRTLAVSPDRRWLVTCCSVPGELWVHDAGTYELVSRRLVFDNGFNLGVPAILPDSSTVILPSSINRTFPISEDNIEKGWAIDNRLTKFPLPDGPYWQQKQLGLDVRGNASGDPHAAAISADGRWLLVTCGGSHELLVLDFAKVPWPPADPGDFVPPELRDSADILRRVELGGRPLGVTFVDGRRAAVANYLSNAVQLVDVADAKLMSTISLGGAESPSLARRGEAIFYDADRSLASWFSCHTCHTGGHTSGQTFDTLNDGNYDTQKLAPSLRDVVHTGPWTWHGWQTSLSDSVRKSLRDTMGQGRPTSEEDVRALVAFLKTLEHPRSPHRQSDGSLTEAARRGRTLFEGKAGCTACHAGPYLTSSETYRVGLESPRYFYREFNPPSLRGLATRRRFLHDGRAENPNEVLTRHHRPQELAGGKLTPAERDDLIAYLKSL